MFWHLVSDVASLNDLLHWPSLLAKPSAILHHCLTCLAHLTQCNTDRIISIFVMLPKVAKARSHVAVAVAVIFFCHWYYQAKLHQWKDSLNINFSIIYFVILLVE
jgi:hypothetical protein